MATDQGYESMTAEELRTFAEKLQAWGRTLSEKEQAFLVEILSRAAGGDTAGFMHAAGMPAASQETGAGALPAGFDVDTLLPALQQIAQGA